MAHIAPVVYATPDEIKRVLGQSFEEGKPSDDDLLLRRFAVQASRAFDMFCTNLVRPDRHFYPVQDTRNFDHPDETTFLRLGYDILEATTVTTNNGGTTIDAADYELVKARGNQPPRHDMTPYDAIALRGDGTVTAFEFDDTATKANAVTGTWGYHTDWANAWEDSQDAVQDDPLSDSATTLTVTSADGLDLWGFPYRFKDMQLLRIESEYLLVTAVRYDNETLTVVRGVLGTTAASHVQGTQIDIFRPMPDLVMAVQTLAIHMYRRRDAIGTPDQRPLAAAKGLLVFPDSLPEEVKRMLIPYAKGTVKARR